MRQTLFFFPIARLLRYPTPTFTKKTKKSPKILRNKKLNILL